MKPIVIIGDSMLDVDVEGSANRLSPEAPVPVVEPDRIWRRPGGAGLAAVLAARVHPNVVLITATADDSTVRLWKPKEGTGGRGDRGTGP